MNGDRRVRRAGGVDLALARTAGGRRLEVSRVVDASCDDCWDLLTDTEQWPVWGPSVGDVASSSRYIEDGTTGRIRVPPGVWVPFEITSCADHRWTWDVGLPLPDAVRNAIEPLSRLPATGHRVEACDGGCRVVFEIPVLAAGYAVVCRRALRVIDRLATDEDGGEGEKGDKEAGDEDGGAR